MGFDKYTYKIKILVAVIIVLMLFSGYLVLINNSTFKVKTAIKYIFNNANSSLELLQNSPVTSDLLKNKVEITNRLVAKITLSEDVIQSFGPVSKKIENFINSSTIETNIKSDATNNFMDIALNYKYNNEIIATNAYIDNNEVYILLKNYFDKYIKLDSKAVNVDKSFGNIVSGAKAEDVIYLIEILEKSIVDSIDYGEISTSHAQIEIDEEKLNVNKTTLKIDTKLVNQISTIVLNKIIMDIKAKEILLKLLDSKLYPDVSYLEDEIRKMVLSIQTSNYNNELLGEYSLYTSGVFNNIVRNEFKLLNSEETVIQYTTYKTDKFDSQFCIYTNNELMSQFNIKETTKDNYDISITYGSDMSLDIKGLISDSNIDVNFTLRISGLDDAKGDVRVETKKISQYEVIQKFNARLNTPESYGSANLTIDSTFKAVNNITKPDFTNNITSITNDDSEKIMSNFEIYNPRINKALNDIMKSLIAGNEL